MCVTESLRTFDEVFEDISLRLRRFLTDFRGVTKGFEGVFGGI